MAANGYPGSYEKGSRIGGLDRVDLDDVIVFHAGTARDNDDVIATGGRVLGVTGLGDGIAAAREKAYEAIARIDWPGGFYRRDIGWRAMAREEEKDGGAR